MDARKTAWDRLMTYRFEDADSDRLSIETIDALTYARDTLATQQSRIEALENAVELAKSAWNHQQARIEALEDFNYRRRKAYRDRVIDALHNMDTEESPELEDVLNLAHNAIYNAVTKALLEGE